MTNADRFKFLFGPYLPRFRYGDVVMDEGRDFDAIIVDITNARIPWPIGKRKGGRDRSLLVYGGLAEAIRHESNQAIYYWFGITGQTVTKWRKALEVGTLNEGTCRLKRDYFHEPWARKMRRKASANASDPKRCAKIAAARRGKLRPPEVIEKMRRAALSRKATEETRRKKNIAAERRNAWPPAADRPRTAEEDELLRTRPTEEVARMTGRTLLAIWAHRRTLGLPDGRRRKR
ncbi:MAG TPA: hypothetical protein VGZ47_20690 [Gemmataceae bacterium]|jgi:hypothetical protein|nr:hypothetical protein [Gemmataceae bacterium]